MGGRGPLVPLPVDDVLPRLLEELARSGCVVLEAPTGSGKTTRVASAILSSDLADLPGEAGRGQVIMLEPRRVAARAAARRIAWERDVRLGDEVGYQVRFDSRMGRETRLRIVTDGVLLRLLQDDPFLEQVSVVVFDEFHERGLNVDLALGMVRRIQQTVRPDLKIVVMSATLAAQPIAAYLGNCPIVAAQGSLFPVEVEYLGKPGHALSLFSSDGEDLLVRAVQKAARETPGGILVFLPGVGEIRRATRALESWASIANLMVLPLYGDLPPEQQDRVLAPQSQRKLILATNVAETSLTIDDVTAVVDTGLSRVMHYDEHVGMDRLDLGRISRASADQRRGRAGRTAPGRCYRLWSERDHRSLAEFETPEVARVDLAGPVLQLRVFGEPHVASFPWFEAPRSTSIDSAQRLLDRLGALREGQVTSLGNLMARLPVHPRVARLLIEGVRLGCTREAALAAAMLSERDPLRSGPPQHGSRKIRMRSGVTESDLSDRVQALLQFAESGSERTEFGELHGGGARFILQAANQLLGLLEGIPGPPPSSCARETDDVDTLLQKAVLSAYPDRVAVRRGSSLDRGVMVGGRGVRLHHDSKVIEARLFVCVNVDAGATESVVRMASAVREDWLDPNRRVTREEVLFDDRTGRVAAVRRDLWDDLVLDEVALGHVPEELVAGALVEAAGRNLSRILPRDGEVADYVARVKCLGDWMPDLGLPPLDEGEWKGLLPMLCQGCRTLDDVKRADWLPWVKSLLTPAQQQQVEREAPERITVPTGNRIAIQYSPGKRPVLAVRIQELFGLAETPRIAGGRVPLLMHLLAPNMRPQQVTDDLKSFWNNTYQQVRKDLRARYPKHAWPEDPWNAPPQSRPKRRDG
ncbi:MAG TPA: ATP-dependent helicase HrpB [Planctomycetaceae bacterium]|nr:ATP-dependent helicase HrpB [Planctomycetaceae bacterium]